MKVYWKLLAAGVLGYLIFLVVTFPAQFVFGKLAAQGVNASAVSGTLWKGRALNLRIGIVSLGDLDWRLKPGSLFAGKLDADFNLKRPDGFAQGAVSASLNGRIILNNVTASLPVDAIVGSEGLPGASQAVRARARSSLAGERHRRDRHDRSHRTRSATRQHRHLSHPFSRREYTGRAERVDRFNRRRASRNRSERHNQTFAGTQLRARHASRRPSERAARYQRRNAIFRRAGCRRQASVFSLGNVVEHVVEARLRFERIAPPTTTSPLPSRERARERALSMIRH
jgi:Type II secretion system (T2SS), protein N